MGRRKPAAPAATAAAAATTTTGIVVVVVAGSVLVAKELVDEPRRARLEVLGAGAAVVQLVERFEPTRCLDGPRAARLAAPQRGLDEV